MTEGIVLTLPMFFGACVPAIAIIGIIINLAVRLSATETKATEAATVALHLDTAFNEYRVMAATLYASNTSLKLVEERLTAAIGDFARALDRHTDRLDKLIQSRHPHEH